MKGGERVAITGVGAMTPIGCTAAETAASLRAGICRFCEQDFYWPLAAEAGLDQPQPVVASVVPGLSFSLAGAARIVELGAGALQDLFGGQLLSRVEAARAGLFLALPERDAVSAGWDLGASLGPTLVRRVGLPAIRVLASRFEGGAGSLGILGDAAAALRAGTIDRAIVLCLDTFIDRDRLRHLDQEFRVKSVRASAGMIPGEAAVALILEPAGAAARRGTAALAEVAAIGIGLEPQPLASDRESSGRGLCEAVRSVLPAPVWPGPRRWVLCDLNGEAYRAVEWGITLGRLARELGVITRLSHAADCLGHVGAATGGIFLVQAAGGFARGYAPASEALLWATADTGLRAAARVMAPARGSTSLSASGRSSSATAAVA